MFRRSIPCICLCILVISVSATFGQAHKTRQPSIDPDSNAPWITATAGTEQVRFASLGIVQRIRLEVLNRVGDIVFDSDFREGNLLDWKVDDKEGHRLPEGMYGCMVTVESISGQMIRRQGIFKLMDGSVKFGDIQNYTAEAAISTEGQESVTVLRGEEGLALIHLAHDGKDGRIVSGRGGLSLGTGDLFSGKDVEHMRLTADGRLGLGVEEPAAKLDVAGLIRTSEGIQFSDGSILKMEGGNPVLVPASSQRTGGKSGSGSSSANEGTRSVRLLTTTRETGAVALSGGGSGRVFSTEGETVTFYGQGAGASNTGDYNSFFGSNAGLSNTTGQRNSFFGFHAGTNNTFGGSNSFFGHLAGAFNTGDYNSFFGRSAGEINSTGSHNSFFGHLAGSLNTTGDYNSFFGRSAGEKNSIGHENSFFGVYAGASNTTGSHNSFFGYAAGVSNTTGGYNSFFGHSAGYANNTGSTNSFFGHEAGVYNTTGYANSFVGTAAGHENTTGYANSFFGFAAGSENTTGYANSFFGWNAGQANTTGYANSFFGWSAGLANTTGADNAFFGNAAGYFNTTGVDNAFFGDAAGAFNTQGSANSFFGRLAGNSNTTGGANSFFGKNAGASNTTGADNAFLGFEAGMNNTTGQDNTFLGFRSGKSNTTGGWNSFFGNGAGASNTTGDTNSSLGFEAGKNNTTGSLNTFLGFRSGQSNVGEIYNTFLGASSNGAENILNATAVGYCSQVTRSNSLVLGGVYGVNCATAEVNVGIGTTSPDRQLVVEGSQALGKFRRFNDTGKDFAAALLFERARGAQLQPWEISPGDYLGKVQFRGRVGGNYPEYGALAFIASDTNQNGRFAFLDRDIATERVSILNTGNVGIGTSAPTERLHVVGNIRVTGSITYGAPETDVPDYVFNPDYRLMQIDDLEKFIKLEKHLPNVPAAGEIKDKGLNLSEFQMKLLEKIEELTLYTVQQAKTIKSKEAEVALLRSQIEALDARLAAVERKR